ncbi:hypothetical protein KJ785_00080 [Patescibacteria group bacterium]|nr:hypothetical protein [Patescibacteria group bacterium]
MSGLFCLFSKPEYIALFISVLAICINVYIVYRNRRYSLAKEEYFKLQQTVEKIIAKLLILNNHQVKLKIFFELSFKAEQNKNIKFIDLNDTFSRDRFEKKGEEITALIDIYFSELGEDWNDCLEKFSGLITLVFVLNKKIEDKINVNWVEEKKNFNKLTLELGDRPKYIADKLKEELIKFKKENL